MSCKKAKHIRDNPQYGETFFIEIIQLNICLTYHKATRAYPKKHQLKQNHQKK